MIRQYRCVRCDRLCEAKSPRARYCAVCGKRTRGKRHGTAPHHQGPYKAAAAAVRVRANADPFTVCRCGRTLAEHLVPHATLPWSRKAKWTAGHVIDGQIGGALIPEVSCCNYSRGARRGNAIRRGQSMPAGGVLPLKTSRDWHRPLHHEGTP